MDNDAGLMAILIVAALTITILAGLSAYDEGYKQGEADGYQLGIIDGGVNDFSCEERGFVQAIAGCDVAIQNWKKDSDLAIQALQDNHALCEEKYLNCQVNRQQGKACENAIENGCRIEINCEDDSK